MRFCWRCARSLSIPSAGRTRNEANPRGTSGAVEESLSIPSAGRTRNEAHHAGAHRAYPPRHFQYPLRVVPGMKHRHEEELDAAYEAFQYPLRVVPGMKPLLGRCFAAQSLYFQYPLRVVPGMKHTTEGRTPTSEGTFNTLCGSYQE